MPVALPPIDRRRFLAGVLGSLALAGSGHLFAQEAADPDTWAFLSDTHIPGDPNKAGGKPPVKPVEHFTKIRADILSGAAGKPCGALVTGDCVYIEGLPNDYVTLLAEFAPLRKAGLSVHFLMGNHDNREAFLRAAAKEIGGKEPETIPDRLCSVVETPRANFFLMDSLERTNYTPGLFGDEQLRWLEDELDRRKDKPAILFAHHYPDYTSGIAANPHALKDTDAFFDRIKDRKQVKAYVYGHAHIWKTVRRHGIHLVNLPTTAWRFDQSQPFAWVLARLRDNGMSMTLRSLDPEHPKHDETVDLEWRAG